MEVVYGTMTKVLEKLGFIAYEQISLAWGMRDDLMKLRRTMSTVKAVLLDADEKQAHNREISTWLADLKHVFLDAEEVLDEFECEILRRKVVKLYGSTSQKVRRYLSCSNPLVLRINLGRKLKEIRKRLDEVADGKTKFHLSERHEETRASHGRTAMTHSYVCAKEVVGRIVDKENIICLLMEPSDCLNVSVIPMCGIGGMGKTTLAKLVYNDERVKNHFELRMWVCISEDFDISRLIKEILNSATGRVSENLTLDQLQNLLRDKLKDQRFLLILDDVWNDIPEKWFALRELLMNGSKGSKIIVTTRKHSVADLMGTSPTYYLKGLYPEDCLSLFVKWAFRNGAETQHQNLVNIGKQIVEKCRGVPLAVTTLASLLHLKLEERDWKYIRDSEIWKLEQIECHILPALQLSYNELPPHLKRCFHYCSLFPKGHEFRSSELVELWMAHGVLQSHDENRSLEEIGELYFKELWSRSFFQDVENYEFFYVFRMHDLIHDLAQSMTQNEFSILNTPAKSISERVQHLSITYRYDEVPACLDRLNSVRTIVFPSAGFETLRNSLIEKYISKFKSLRMVHLRYSSFETLPSCFCCMKHLRYLDLSYNNEIKKLPNSICKLQSLQTLKLVGCGNLEGLPRDIKNLISLRFLSLTTKATFFPENGIECLTSLRTLLIFDCESLVSLPRNFRCLTALETLVIGGCTKLRITEDEDNDQVNKISLKRLQFSHLPEMVALPQWLRGCEGTLELLRLFGCPKLTALPQWLPNMTSLEKLRIMECPGIQSLPEGMHHLITSLREMKIYGCPELSNFIETVRDEEWIKNIYFEDDPWRPT